MTKHYCERCESEIKERQIFCAVRGRQGEASQGTRDRYDRELCVDCMAHIWASLTALLRGPTSSTCAPSKLTAPRPA